MKNSIQEHSIEKLQSIREEQDMSVSYVAGMMKVSQDFIHAIESGDFEQLGAPTFVRGHIMNYCKVIKIDPQHILSQIPSQLLQHQQLQTSNAMGSSPLARVRRQSNHFGKYAIGTALLGMLCLSFYFVWDKWSMPQPTDSVNDIAIAQNSEDGEEQITYSSLIPQVVGPKPQPEVRETAQPQDSTSNEADAVESTEVVPVSPVQVDESNDDAITDEEFANAEPVNEDSPSAVEVELSETLSGYAIRLDLQEQAWVSIKTQNGESVVQDLLGPGINEFKSDEPLQFRIGNADQLTLSINNQPVELAPHTTKDVADFKWPLEPNS